MSCFNLPKKLKQLPSSSKKVWNSLKSSISPKLRTLRNNYNKCSNTLPTTLTKTATRLFDHKRRRSTPRPRYSGGGRARARDFYNSYNQHNDYQHLQPYTSVPNSPATVYIDRLFEMSKEEVNKKDVTATTTMMEEPPSSSGSTTVRGDDGGGKKRKKVGSNNKDRNKSDNNNKWKEYISSMPKIKGVDERAEEFISKFRQDMQIQREQSLIEFQKMLARTA